MSLHAEIKGQIKDAMQKREAVRLSVVRGLVAAFVNELVAKGRKPEGELTDEETLSVIKRGVKQRKDSIEQFRKGNREDLVKAEEAELPILEKFLPAMMSENDIRKIAAAKMEELKIADKAKIGILVGAVMKECKGRADGTTVKTIIERFFS